MQPDVQSRRLPSRNGIGSARTAVQSLAIGGGRIHFARALYGSPGSLPLHRRWHSRSII